MRQARAGHLTLEMERVAQEEGISPEIIMEGIAQGSISIPCNRICPKPRLCGIGAGLRTKVNANIGTSKDNPNLEQELEKLQAAIEAGCDTVMDLSTGGDIRQARRKILETSPVPLGTVPIYQAAIESIEEFGAIIKMPAEKLFSIIEEQAKEGVDFVTVHSGLTMEALQRLRKQGRLMDIVSRGGAFLVSWMIYHERENPLYEHFDWLLDIAQRYDLTLSLGDGLRPGALADATDRAQIQELITLGELAEKAWEADVQVLIEGPGHLPMDEIETNIMLQKRLCRNAPFYVLGPIVTDIAPGYDHISSAIGAAIAAKSGADFICYVTPSEHLRLPTPDDVREGVIAARIAGHAADIVKGVPGARERDRHMSAARKNQEWERQIQLAIYPKTAKKLREASPPLESETCTMCGEFCAISLIKKFLAPDQPDKRNIDTPEKFHCPSYD
ncbi:MAG: phosphomethylpyrimidine synthase ThiC [bacterium]